ncbi:MAG: hypothetical protein Q9157_006554 [Trypethelium eluteriae]
MSREKYNPIDDIPDLSGKVILVTGGNSGLGKETIVALAKHKPNKIYLAARNVSKAQAAVKDIEKRIPGAPTSILEFDLSSLHSVMEAARRVISESQRLDILMCNGGIVALPMAQSKDGYEIQFATNHLGHALLIKLLLPLLLKTAQQYSDARVIILASPAAGFVPKEGIQFDTLRTTQDLGFGGKPQRYGQSKLANILYADELSRRYPQLRCASINPGIAKTELYTEQGWLMRVFIVVTTWLRGKCMVSPEEGAYNQLWAATTPKKNIPLNGALYDPVGQLAKPIKNTDNDDLRERLWAWTEKQLDSFTL